MNKNKQGRKIIIHLEDKIMINDKILKQLVGEFSKPRLEFNGESYVTRRREWFDKPMENIRPLIKNPEAVDGLTLENAERIYREATVGGPQLHPRTFRENGIEKIRKSFKYLLFGDEPLEKRFYNVVENSESEYRLGGIGRAFASTLLFLLDHKNNGIWNNAIDGGLEILDLLPPKEKSENKGERYIKIVRVLKGLAQQCSFEDLSLVDEFVELIFHEKIGMGIIPESQIETVLPTVSVPSEELKEIPAEEKKVHLQMEWMLIKIGKWEGYDAWVATNDLNKEFSGEKFSGLCLSEIPHFAGPNILRIARMVDVIWFKKGTAMPARFFEVEHSTSIYSGLLRLNDIIIDYPIPKASIITIKQSLFESQITRRTFTSSGLNEVCDVMDYKRVEEWFEHEKKIQEIKG